MTNQTEEINGIIYCYFNRKKFEQEGIKKYYVGQTVTTIEQRAGKDGENYGAKDPKCNTKFAHAIRKWGWDSFDVTIIEEGIKTREKLDMLEKYYIYTFNSITEGYNICSGGNDSFKTVCPHCGQKIKCSCYICPFCRKQIEKTRKKIFCEKCGTEIKNINSKCPECGYSKNHELIGYCENCGEQLPGNNFSKCLKCGHSPRKTYICPICGKHLLNISSVCECGYDFKRTIKYYCKQCGEQIEHPNSRCKCGFCIMDNINCYCRQCGEPIKSPLNICHKCGYNPHKKHKCYCKKCGSLLSGNNFSRCLECGYLTEKHHTCKSCGYKFTHPHAKCPECGYDPSKNKKYYCKKCGTELKNKSGSAKCLECGYSPMHDVKFYCKNCGHEIKSSFSKCPNCNITNAGMDSWKKFNPTYKISLDNEVLIRDIYTNCVNYLMNLLNISENKAKGTIKKGIYTSKNKTKYNQLKFEKVSE